MPSLPIKEQPSQILAACLWGLKWIDSLCQLGCPCLEQHPEGDGNEGPQSWLQGNSSVLTSVLGQALSPLMRDVRTSQAGAS